MARHGRPVYRKQAELPVEEHRNTDKSNPTFCLEFLQGGFDVKNPEMTKDAKAAFAERLQELASMSWSEIKRQGRHAQGFELINVAQLAISLPEAFEGKDQVMAFRYHGKHPMVGIRAGATLHILAIEREFDELYKH